MSKLQALIRLFACRSPSYSKLLIGRVTQLSCVLSPCDILDGHDPTGNALRPNSRSTGYQLMKVFNLNILWQTIDLLLSQISVATGPTSKLLSTELDAEQRLTGQAGFAAKRKRRNINFGIIPAS